jgi:hypothetical protein
MNAFQWAAIGVCLVVYGLLLAFAVWAVHTRGKLAGAARAYRDIALRTPRDPAKTIVAPAYHAPLVNERVRGWGPHGGTS